jgi:hypothetical protein
MSKVESIDACLKEIERRYNESEKARGKLKSFDDPIQFEFQDTGRTALLLIHKDQGIETKNDAGDEIMETDVLILLFFIFLRIYF